MAVRAVANCTRIDYDRQGGRDRLVGQAVPNDVEGLRWLASGASLGRRMCSPCLRPSVQFLPGCVHFPAKCVQFPARCVHYSRRFPQMCPLGPRMCPPGPLTGDSRRPGLPGRSGSDFGGRAALGTRRASARGPGHRPTLADLPFRDLCVTRGGLPGRPSPQPSPTGRGGKSGRALQERWAICKGPTTSPFSGLRWFASRGSGEGVPWCSIIGAGDGPGGYWRPPRGTSRPSSRSRRSNWRVRSVRWDWPMSAMNCQ